MADGWWVGGGWVVDGGWWGQGESNGVRVRVVGSG